MAIAGFPAPPSLAFPPVFRLFRHYCQKVLPAVYDDSLSYYELLCKVADYLNKTLEAVNELNSDLQELYEFVLALAEYCKQIDVLKREVSELRAMLCALAQNALVYDVTTGTYRPSMAASRRMFQALRFDGMTVRDLATFTVAEASTLNVRHVAVDGRAKYMNAGDWDGGIPRQTGYECAAFNPDEYIKKSDLTPIDSDNLQSRTILGVLEKDAASAYANFSPYLRRYTALDLNQSWVRWDDHVVADFEGKEAPDAVS